MALLLMFDGKVYSKYFTKPGSKVFSSKTVNIIFAGKPDDYIFLRLVTLFFRSPPPEAKGVLQI